MLSEYQNSCAFDFFLLQSSRHRKCNSFKNCVALLPGFRDCHYDGSVSSNVRYVTCSHRTYCHVQSQAGRVQCFKMAKIDPVSPIYPTLWLKKATLQWENEPLGCKYLNCKYLIIHSPQSFSGIIYNTGWGTLPDFLRCSLQVLKEWVMMPPYMGVKVR